LKLKRVKLTPLEKNPLEVSREDVTHFRSIGASLGNRLRISPPIGLLNTFSERR
jgi:hypothetical protein